MRAIAVSVVLGVWCTTAAAAVPPACRVTPTDPMSDPTFLYQAASTMMRHGDDTGLEYLQLANEAQREIGVREAACVVCGKAGFAEGTIERANCIADQVAKNRPPRRPSAPAAKKIETITECQPDFLGGFSCRSADKP